MEIDVMSFIVGLPFGAALMYGLFALMYVIDQHDDDGGEM